MTVQLEQDYMVTAQGGIGVGVGALPERAVVVPTQILPPGTAGVGYSGEDTVICRYEDTASVPGRTVNRNLSFPVSQFEATCTLASEVPPPEPPPEPVTPTGVEAADPQTTPDDPGV